MKSWWVLAAGVVVLVVAAGAGFWVMRSGGDDVLRSERGVSILITTPHSGAVVSNPIRIRGKVPGSWTFEANFGVELLDAHRTLVATGYATVKGNWMTEQNVAFSASVPFEHPKSRTGFLVLHKANPSDLEGKADSVEVPVRFRK